MRWSLVRPASLAAVLLVSMAPLPVLAEAVTADYEQVVDLTFPTDPAVTYIDDYHAPRSGGRVHSATDLMGEKLLPIYAAVGGVITAIPMVKPSYGYMIRIAGDDGRSYSYIHLNDDTPGTSDSSAGPEHAYAPGLDRGSRVARGQHIGWMGDSGNAKGGRPHLHFVIADSTVRDPYGAAIINPYNSLEAARVRGDHAKAPSGSAPTPGQDDVPESATVDRISGDTRITTAVQLSTAGYARADTVVLASAVSFADAVVAGPLAAALEAPLLTTFGRGLEGSVSAEIRRLGATKAVIVGPRQRVSGTVERDLLATTDVTTDGLSRIASPEEPTADPALVDAVTAAHVAAEVRALTGSPDVLVALGSHPGGEHRAWPDALTAGYHGAVTGQPVLLVDHGAVPDSILVALTGVRTATIVGGTGAVSAALAETIEGSGATVRRLAGQDRFATAGAVADDLLQAGLVDPSRLWAATGTGYADALAAASTLAATRELLVLIDGSSRGGDRALDPWFAARAGHIDVGRVIGGAAAVSDGALAQLAERIR
jgi:hypothetical protein